MIIKMHELRGVIFWTLSLCEAGLCGSIIGGKLIKNKLRVRGCRAEADEVGGKRFVLLNAVVGRTCRCPTDVFSKIYTSLLKRGALEKIDSFIVCYRSCGRCRGTHSRTWESILSAILQLLYCV